MTVPSRCKGAAPLQAGEISARSALVRRVLAAGAMRLILIAMLWAWPAVAQESALSPPPLTESTPAESPAPVAATKEVVAAPTDALEVEDEPPAPEQLHQVGPSPYWNTCNQVWRRSVTVAPHPWHVSQVLSGPPPASGSSSGGSAPSGGGSFTGGSGGGGIGRAPEALLVLAVVALAVLPVIVYAVDSEADPLTLDRFYCPEFSFSVTGGALIPTQAGQSVTPLGVAKLRADLAYVGAMVDFGFMPSGGTLAAGFSTHFLLRAKPKAHLEGAFAIGFRRAVGPRTTLDGLELALPHMYVFSRDGYKKLGLEVMPRVLLSRAGVDVGAELAMVIPIADVLQIRAGGGVFSLASQTLFSASAGVTAHW